MESAAQILQKHKIEKLPIVGMDGKLIGLITYKDITKAKDKPMACKDAKGRLRVAAGVGCYCRYAGSYAGLGRCRCGCNRY